MISLWILYITWIREAAFVESVAFIAGYWLWTFSARLCAVHTVLVDVQPKYFIRYALFQ